jgi:hypothetical protein
MGTLNDVPENQVPSVVEEALRDGATRVTITKQDDDNYAVSWE